jgi:hypothetical protein
MLGEMFVRTSSISWFWEAWRRFLQAGEAYEGKHWKRARVGGSSGEMEKERVW